MDSQNNQADTEAPMVQDIATGKEQNTPRGGKRILRMAVGGAVFTILVLAAGLAIMNAGGEADTDGKETDWSLQETAQTARNATHLACDGWYALQDDFDRHCVISRRMLYEEGDVYGEAYGISITYADEDGAHTERWIEGTGGPFLIIGDMLYYSRHGALYRKRLSKEAEEEFLLAEDVGVFWDFVCYNDRIYYLNKSHELCCYDPETGENDRISDVKIDCYDIWNDAIYYENVSDRTLCKMRLDGTGIGQINRPYDNRARLCQLTVCPYRDKVYLACTTRLDNNNSLLLFAEDDQAACWGVTGGEYESVYYRDGCLYYTSDFGWEIHAFHFEKYFDGEGGNLSDSYDVIFYPVRMDSYEVTDEFIYVKGYWYPYMIEVYERVTGELIQMIDGRDINYLKK